MKATISVLNSLERRGIIERYAIGGAVAALFYVEPFETEDLDVFVILPSESHPLTPLAPLYDELRREGYAVDGLYLMIEGLPVQFLPAYNDLISEAVSHARQVPYETELTWIPHPEYLAAIMIQTGRAKDRARFQLFREQASLDANRLEDILVRHRLMEKYRQWSQ